MQAKKVLAVQDPVGSHEVFAPMVLPQASPYEEAPVAAQTRPIRLRVVVRYVSVLRRWVPVQFHGFDREIQGG